MILLQSENPQAQILEVHRVEGEQTGLWVGGWSSVRSISLNALFIDGHS